MAQYVQRFRQPSAIFRYALPGKESRCSRSYARRLVGALNNATGPGQQLDDPRRVAVAEKPVDLGQLLREILPVALREAPDHEHLLFRVALLQLEARLDGFLLGRGDEAARVDDEDVGLLGRGCQAPPCADERGDHPLGVDLVLCAAEAFDVEGAAGRDVRAPGGSVEGCDLEDIPAGRRVAPPRDPAGCHLSEIAQLEILALDAHAGGSRVREPDRHLLPRGVNGELFAFLEKPVFAVTGVNEVTEEAVILEREVQREQSRLGRLRPRRAS